MASKYASLLFGPEEYRTIGPFRFPVYKDLTPGEARKFEDLTRTQTKTMYASMKLAKHIAKDKGITTKQALNLLSELGTENMEAEEVMYDYIEEIENLQSNSMTPTEQKIVWATIFIRNRGEAQFDGEDALGWQGMPDWEEKDTEQLPTYLLDEIYQLILWERDGWPEDAEGKSPEIETVALTKS